MAATQEALASARIASERADELKRQKKEAADAEAERQRLAAVAFEAKAQKKAEDLSRAKEDAKVKAQ